MHPYVLPICLLQNSQVYLSIYWLWSDPPESTADFLLLQHFSYFLLSSPRRCFISVFVVADVALMSKEPFTWTEQMSCVYHGRTKGEVCGHVKSI